MTLKQLLVELPGACLTDCPEDRFEIRGGYACDMLSLVVSRLETGQVWLTILNSINVVAVAVLADCPCVILTESVTMDAPVLQRARDQGLIVFSTPLTTYQAAVAIDRLLQEN